MHLEWQPVSLAGKSGIRTLEDVELVAAGPPILTSLTPGETEELQTQAQGARVLEIGSANGYSACVMALAGAKYIDAIDDHSGNTWLGDTFATMQLNLDAYGVSDKVTMIPANSRVAMPSLVETGEKYDFIFIDGDHLLDGASADIADALKLIEPGGTIAVHDFLEHCCCPDVMYACNRAFPQGPTAVIDTMFVIDL